MINRLYGNFERVGFILLFIILSGIFFLTASFASEDLKDKANSGALTLFDCYQLALKQSETIAIKGYLIKEADAHFLQAMSVLLPHLSFVSTNDWSDRSNLATTTGEVNGLEQKFTYKQTLFSGFKAMAGIRGSGFEKEQRQKEKKRAEDLLLLDVANSFYLLLEQKEDMASLEKIRRSLIERIKDLREREKLGRSRKSEVVNTETQLYNVNAEIELTNRRLILARQLLEFLTGVTIHEITEKNDELPALDTEAAYTALVDSRPDVEASAKALEVAKQEKVVAQSDLLPTVSTESNYYTKRPDALDGIKWDALLKVSIPIFEGTEVYGAVQEAALKASEAQMQFRHTKRQAFLDIRDAYANIQTAIPITIAYKKALRAAQMNYALQKTDYQLSLVNNLDVLAAIKTLEDTRRNFIQAFYEMKRFYWQLRVAVGQVDPGELK
jgi:outer membrane protein